MAADYDLIQKLWDKIIQWEGLIWNENRKIHVGLVPKGYKSPNDEDGAENVILEGEQSQTHVGEDEILSQEVKDLKELDGKHNFHHKYTVTIPEKYTVIIPQKEL